MKKMILLVSFLMAGSLFAQSRQFELTSEKLVLGELSQTRGASAHETIEVTRTEDSPEKVTLQFSVEELTNVCSLWDYRDVWVPGYRDVVCHTDRFGNTHCRTIFHPGYYRSERFCAQYRSVPMKAYKEIRLNFKKAKELTAGEQEVFGVTLSQKGSYTAKIEASARALDTESKYEIKFKKFLVKDQLVFKVK